MPNNDLILKKYDEKVNHYVRYCERIRFILMDILSKEGLYINSIHSRVKSKPSLIKKINRPDATYKCLEEVTDIAGLRVTTYFASDVDKVAQMIKRKFQIDNENSIDKRDVTDPDRFGYLSLHYVVSLTACNMTKPDFKVLEGLKAEIQVRSILQHAWAEMEHDLGYKSKYSIPFTMRRRFSRLSGLLELADEEFNSLRNDLRAYKERIEESEYIDKYIDKISLLSFIGRSDLIKELDQAISTATGNKLEREEWFIESLVAKLKFIGINEFEKLMIQMGKRRKMVVRLADIHLKERSSSTRISNGVCIFYFCTVILAERGDVEEFRRYLKRFRLVSDGFSREFASNVIEKYNIIKEENPDIFKN